MKVTTTCLYCDNKEVFHVYEAEILRERKCGRCGDKKKKLLKEESSDPFGYNSDKPREDAYIGD